MPFARNSELPKGVRDALPGKAQTMFRRVFNNAIKGAASEERSFKIAWGAIKRAGWKRGEDGKWRMTKMSKLTDDIRRIGDFLGLPRQAGDERVDDRTWDDLQKRQSDAMTMAEAVADSQAESKVSDLTSKLHELVWALDTVLRNAVVEGAENKVGIIEAAYADFQKMVAAIIADPTQTVAAGQPDAADVHVSAHPGKKPKDKKKKPKHMGQFQGGTFKLAKVDEDEHLVFGFFSIIEEAGKAVVDDQDDVIEISELEKAAYSHVLEARVAGDEHKRVGVGDLIESIVFTDEKQAAIVQTLKDRGIDAVMDLKSVGWWGGYHITDDKVWKAIKDEQYVAFSIGGEATRVLIEDDAKAA